MLILHILNMKNFLHTINECEDEVCLLHKDGSKQNITRQYFIQNDLLKQFHANKDYLTLKLLIKNPKDHFRISCYYCGDC